MEYWAIYTNEEWEIRAFANAIAPECDHRMDDISGNLSARIGKVDIRYLPRSRKLISLGEMGNVKTLKRQYMRFIENEQLKRGERKDVAMRNKPDCA